jgi:quercetin dioxygenase-like cupin family protein
MPFVDTGEIEEHEQLPGWHGRIFQSPSMTFATWRFSAGAEIHRHHHPQEEVWQILEGELEISIGGETRRAGPSMAAIVPAGTEHRVVALTDGVAMVADWPLREDLGPGGARSQV